MLEHVTKVSNIVVSTAGVWLPGLFIVAVYALPKVWPKSDDYFQKGFLVLQEVDDVTDAILEEYPQLEWVNTTDDVVERALDILSKRYELDDDEKEKAEKRIKAKIKNDEGISVNWKDGTGKINFKKEF